MLNVNPTKISIRCWLQPISKILNPKVAGAGKGLPMDPYTISKQNNPFKAESSGVPTMKQRKAGN